MIRPAAMCILHKLQWGSGNKGELIVLFSFFRFLCLKLTGELCKEFICVAFMFSEEIQFLVGLILFRFILLTYSISHHLLTFLLALDFSDITSLIKIIYSICFCFPSVNSPYGNDYCCSVGAILPDVFPGTIILHPPPLIMRYSGNICGV